MSTDPGPDWRRMATDLAVPAFLVVAGTFIGARLLDVRPWTAPAYDVWAYWLTRDGMDYAALRPGDTGAFLYSPAFAQAIAPLVALPWPVFAALWTALQAALLLWLSGRRALPVLLLPPVALSVLLGQLDLAFAAVALTGLRWPVVWALPLLTKVTPGVALVWFLVRGEWRSLAIALGATGIIAGVSYLADPQAWVDWIGLLRRREFPELGDGLIYLPVPIWLRLPLAALLVAWGARTGRRWVLPVGVCLALPTIWLNSPAILVALLPLAAVGAATPAGAWLRRARGRDARSLRPLPPRGPRGTVPPGEEELADARGRGG
ncbi:MAG: hypothetical protein Q8M74_00680 [Chloroflexota bacterium]|nr:hypothetical protein [Chloroflexota bacterium]